MIKIDKEYYYLDLDVMSDELEKDDSLKAGKITNTETTIVKNAEDEIISTTIIITDAHKPKEVDGLKFELLREMIAIVLNTELEYNTSKMVNSFVGAPSNFIIAFNTLLSLKILKKI